MVTLNGGIGHNIVSSDYSMEITYGNSDIVIKDVPDDIVFVDPLKELENS